MLEQAQAADWILMMGVLTLAVLSLVLPLRSVGFFIEKIILVIGNLLIVICANIDLSLSFYRKSTTEDNCNRLQNPCATSS